MFSYNMRKNIILVNNFTSLPITSKFTALAALLDTRETILLIYMPAFMQHFLKKWFLQLFL